MSNQMTVSEALVAGYTHVGTQGSFEGNGVLILKIEELGDRINWEDTTWILCEPDTSTFQIADNLFSEFLNEHLYCQEEVDNEDGQLNDIAAEVADFSEITKKLNEAFTNHQYYSSSGIQLTPNFKKLLTP